MPINTFSWSWFRKDLGGEGPGESRLSVCEPEVRRFLLLPPALLLLSEVLSHPIMLGLVARESDFDIWVIYDKRKTSDNERI
jgi:hypothetical protein